MPRSRSAYTRPMVQPDFIGGYGLVGNPELAYKDVVALFPIDNITHPAGY